MIEHDVYVESSGAVDVGADRRAVRGAMAWATESPRPTPSTVLVRSPRVRSKIPATRLIENQRLSDGYRFEAKGAASGSQRPRGQRLRLRTNAAVAGVVANRQSSPVIWWGHAYARRRRHQFDWTSASREEHSSPVA
jgi:hypothetical protein